MHWLLKDTDTKNGGCVGGKRQSDLDQVVCPKEMFFFDGLLNTLNDTEKFGRFQLFGEIILRLT